MIALLVAGGCCAVVALLLVRALAGPTFYDRALAAHGIVVQAALICAGLAAALGDARAVDVALLLIFAGFAVSVGVLKFFRARTFQAPLSRAEERA